MDKRAIFEHYSHVIDQMIDNSMFWATYFERPYSLEDSACGSDCDNVLMYNITFSCGATRACIIDENLDWVVKFDIEEDAEGSCCEREVRIFEQAEAYNLGKFFAQPVFLGYYNRSYFFYDVNDIEEKMDWSYYDETEFEQNLRKIEDTLTIKNITVHIPLFAYPRADYCNFPFLSKEECKQFSRSNSPLVERNVIVGAAFANEYGFDEYNRLTNFCLQQHINDLHTGNVGTINGHVVLIDYSGYHDCYSTYEEEDSYDVFC